MIYVYMLSWNRRHDLPVTTTATIRNRDVARVKGWDHEHKHNLTLWAIMFTIYWRYSPGSDGLVCQVHASLTQQPSFWLGGYCPERVGVILRQHLFWFTLTSHVWCFYYLVYVHTFTVFTTGLEESPNTGLTMMHSLQYVFLVTRLIWRTHGLATTAFWLLRLLVAEVTTTVVVVLGIGWVGWGLAATMISWEQASQLWYRCRSLGIYWAHNSSEN